MRGKIWEKGSEVCVKRVVVLLKDGDRRPEVKGATQTGTDSLERLRHTRNIAIGAEPIGGLHLLEPRIRIRRNVRAEALEGGVKLRNELG